MQKINIKRLFIFTGIIILVFMFGVYRFMSTGPEKIPKILQTQEGIDLVNNEANVLWNKYMVNLARVDMLGDSDLNLYPSMATIGESITFFPASNIPTHIEVRTSKNRNVRFVFIFEPGTKPQWGNAESTIEIAPNIFVLNSSGWTGTE